MNYPFIGLLTYTKPALGLGVSPGGLMNLSVQGTFNSGVIKIQYNYPGLPGWNDVTDSTGAIKTISAAGGFNFTIPQGVSFKVVMTSATAGASVNVGLGIVTTYSPLDG